MRIHSQGGGLLLLPLTPHPSKADAYVALFAASDELRQRARGESSSCFSSCIVVPFMMLPRALSQHTHVTHAPAHYSNTGRSLHRTRVALVKDAWHCSGGRRLQDARHGILRATLRLRLL